MNVIFVIRLTMLIIVSIKDNYNILLKREWVQYVWAILFIIHQIMGIWDEDLYIEHVAADGQALEIVNVWRPNT